MCECSVSGMHIRTRTRESSLPTATRESLFTRVSQHHRVCIIVIIICLHFFFRSFSAYNSIIIRHVRRIVHSYGNRLRSDLRRRCHSYTYAMIASTTAETGVIAKTGFRCQERNLRDRRAVVNFYLFNLRIRLFIIIIRFRNTLLYPFVFYV